VVHIRNRWATWHTGKGLDLESVAAQPVQLSDALITGYECAGCGPLEEAAQYVGRRAAGFDDGITTCPRCAAPAVRVEIRDAFTVGELMERFGASRVPARFALAAIDGRTVCFNLEEE